LNPPGQKIGRRAGRNPATFRVFPLAEIQNKEQGLPVPAGSRVTFFAGPKKVTNETTALRWACERVLLRIVVTNHVVHSDHCVAADPEVKIKMLLGIYCQSPVTAFSFDSGTEARPLKADQMLSDARRPKAEE